MNAAFRILAALLLTTRVFAETAPQPPAAAVAERFGIEVARAFNERDRAALTKMIDLHALATRAAEYQGLSGQTLQDFVRGAEGVGVDKLISAHFIALDKSKGTVKFMRATKQFPPRSLVRFFLGDSGFTYLEFVLATDAAGRTRAVDWYQIATGDLMSVTLGGVSQLFTANNPGLVERLLGVRPDTSTLRKLQQYGELQRAGKYAEAFAVLRDLPEPLASARVILSMRASMALMAQHADDYDQTLEVMAKHYSSDPAASFQLLDYYFKRRDMPKVLKAIDTMETRVGVDGVTRQVRGNAYLQANDLENALRCIDESIRLEPDRMDAHDLRATMLVQATRYADAVAEYRAMEEQFDLQFRREIFTSEPTFSGFVKSREFGAWLPEQPKAN